MIRFGRRKVTIVFSALLLLVLTVLIGEGHYDVTFMWYRKHYSLQLPITVERSVDAPSIAIAIIINDATPTREYALASSTLHCYAAIHGYRLLVINTAENATWAVTCPQKDFMFHRHCVLRHLLDTMPEEWVLFLDADFGVINPNHLIEEYLPSDSSTHIVFYDRIMNHEVSAGGYFVRNCDFSRRFLKQWADAAFSLPNSWHGTDNGALHMVLLEFALPNLMEGRRRCDYLWRAAIEDSTLDTYTVCTRALMAKGSMEGIEIRNKRHNQRWARDGWLTDSKWSSHDFMLHGWQRRRQDADVFAGWKSPLLLAPGARFFSGVSDDILASHCRALGRNASVEWNYKDSFMVDDEEMLHILEKRIKKEEKIFAQKVTNYKLL